MHEQMQFVQESLFGTDFILIWIGFGRQYKYYFLLLTLVFEAFFAFEFKSIFYMGLGMHFYNKIPSDVLEQPNEKFKIYIKNCLVKKGYLLYG